VRLGGLHDGVDAQREAGGHQRGTEHVSALAEPEASLPRQQTYGERQRDSTDRNVDEERPVPTDGLGDHSTEDEADGRATGRGEAVDTHRPRLLTGSRVKPDDHAEDDRGGQCTADALQEPAGDQDLRTRGHTAER
jgi:hypothetical protein